MHPDGSGWPDGGTRSSAGTRPATVGAETHPATAGLEDDSENAEGPVTVW